MTSPDFDDLVASHTDAIEIRWKNFRSFEDTGWLSIRPLTILLGPNSSGKSTIIAPLLMLAQTILSRDARSPLVTKGRFADLGGYKDLIADHDSKRQLQLALRYHVHSPLNTIEPIGSYPPAGIELTFSAGDAHNSIVLQRLKATDLFNRTYYVRAKTKTGYSLTGVMKQSKMSSHERQAVRKGRATNFLFTPTGTLNAYERLDSERSERRTKFTEDFSHYLKAAGSTSGSVLGFFRKMTYVGPLRDRPARHYNLSGEDIRSVGVRGENSASLLARTRGARRKQLNKWIRQFGFGQSVELVRIAEDLANIEFPQRVGEPINIADLGFGASQVFPLIVQAISADEGTFTIAEQPEVHLHPRLQALLGNLFVELVNQNQRVLLETHSEHMLIRVRTLIAKGIIDADKVAIYFVDCDGGRSHIRRIGLHDDGHIPEAEWPKGFFDDALRESIDLADAQMKFQSSNKNKKG